MGGGQLGGGGKIEIVLVEEELESAGAGGGSGGAEEDGVEFKNAGEAARCQSLWGFGTRGGELLRYKHEQLLICVADELGRGL